MGPHFWCVGGVACEHLVLGDGSVFASCHPCCGPAILRLCSSPVGIPRPSYFPWRVEELAFWVWAQQMGGTCRV